MPNIMLSNIMHIIDFLFILFIFIMNYELNIVNLN